VQNAEAVPSPEQTEEKMLASHSSFGWCCIGIRSVTAEQINVICIINTLCYLATFETAKEVAETIMKKGKKGFQKSVTKVFKGLSTTDMLHKYYKGTGVTLICYASVSVAAMWVYKYQFSHTSATILYWLLSCNLPNKPQLAQSWGEQTS